MLVFSLTLSLLVYPLVALTFSCDDALIEIFHPYQADALATCKTVSGSVVFKATSSPSINLGSLSSIEGDLIFDDLPFIQSILAPELSAIGGKFSLKRLTLLSLLEMPSLERVRIIEWETLPALSSLKFDLPVSRVDTLSISDTGLRSIEESFNLDRLSILNINNNKYLSQLNLLNLSYVNDGLLVSHNGKKMSISLPNLVWTNNITLRDVNSISLPKLKVINTSAIFVENLFTNLILKNVTTIGRTLSISSNSHLTEISFPNLLAIGGGLNLNSNKLLSTASSNSFPLLESIGGSIEVINSQIIDISFPALNDIRGGVKIDTTAPLDCSIWSSLKTQGVIKGREIACTSTYDPSSPKVNSKSDLKMKSSVKDNNNNINSKTNINSNAKNNAKTKTNKKNNKTDSKKNKTTSAKSSSSRVLPNGISSFISLCVFILSVNI